MTNYIAFVDGEPGAYGAVFPDALGCTAMGADLSEVHANAVAALREWMEDRIADGLAPPPARNLLELAQLRPAGDHTLLIVPLLLDAGRTVRANISIDAGLLDQIDEAAKRRGLTRSAFLASAARQKIMSQG